MCVFAFSEPFPPPVSSVEISEGKKLEFTLWDRCDMKGPLTLDAFIQHFTSHYGVTLDTLTYGTTILVSAFSNQKKLKKLLKKDMLKVLSKQVEGFEPPMNSIYLIFEGVGCAPNGEPVVLPTIRYQFK